MSAPLLRVLYRGPLESCNFDCPYCPFGKVPVREDALQEDFAALRRFLAVVRRGVGRPLAVFFTPWGEALIHRPYQQAIRELSHLDGVERVVAQTNLSWPTEWLAAVRAERVALWVTWHPEFMPLDRMLRRLSVLRDRGIAHSVGVVGQREHFAPIAALRSALPDDTYLWVNANKRLDTPYSEAEIGFLTAIDPLFADNLHPHPSQGRWCGAGETSVTVDGDGTVRRCHFLPDLIGRMEDLAAALAPRTCPAAECRCHIGYVHLRDAPFARTYGRGILERIPAPDWPGWGTWHVPPLPPLATDIR